MSGSAVRTQPPLRAILGAFDQGARSLDDVSSFTGLDVDVVRAGVDHLVRLGRIQAKEMTVGCPSGGCGGCALASGCGGAAGAPGPAGRPALVALTPVGRGGR